MLRHYVKVALRSLRRQKGYTFINVGGLAVGMACCLFIFLYVREELSYDRHHPDHDRLYRVALDIQTATANRIFADASATLAPALEQDLPQVEETVRLWPRANRLVARGPEARGYEDRFFFADPEVFDVFYLPLVQGDPDEVLARPGTVVISAGAAARYFGGENPVGQTLTVNGEPYEVTGVLQEHGHNSHLVFDFIASIEPVVAADFFQNWHLTMIYTYVRLKEGVDVAAFEQEIEHFADRYVGDKLQEFGAVYRYFLQPVADIHLHSDLRGEIEPPGSMLYIYIFSAVAVLILLIAALNYINLATARSAQRAREVGVRKVVGSRRYQLVGQFLGESVGLALGALVVAVGLVWAASPWFATLTGYTISSGAWLQPDVLAGLVGLVVCTGVLAGLFPAFVLSAMRPVQVLKGAHGGSTRRATLRKVLVVGQFAISVVLIVSTVTALQQLRYMKDRDLGFEKEQVLVLPVQGSSSLGDHYEEVKADLMRHPSVRAATASSVVPGRGADNFAVRLAGEADDKNQSMYYQFVDYDFLSTYGIDVVAGRGFRRDSGTDAEDAFVINEAAVKAFGWTDPEEALGKRLEAGFGRGGEIVGVYRDFNYRSLHTGVEPLVLAVNPPRFSFISLKLDATDLQAVLAFVEARWQQRFPEKPFTYFFLDEDFDRQYRTDEKTALLMLVFAGLAIGIACLGLLGLAAFSAQERTKEIGIRKVLGASVSGIVLLMTKDFLRLVLVALLVATPLAWLAANRWLDTFAYRMDLSWPIFLLAAGIALLTAVATVSYQAVRAALSDPVKSLRYE